MGKQPVYSRIAAKHVNVVDRVRPEPTIQNWAALREAFRVFNAVPFTVRKVA